MTFVGSTTISDFPWEETLTTFPWENISNYDVCIYLGHQRGKSSSTSAPDRTWPILLPEQISKSQVKVISDFVSEGGGFVAIHSSCVFVREGLTNLIGGRFLSHPPVHNFTLEVEDSTHPMTKGMKPFKVTDELYFTEYDPSVQILLSTTWKKGLWKAKKTGLPWGPDTTVPDPKLLSMLWEGTWKGKRDFYTRLEQGEELKLPMVWVKPHGKGRVVYIAPGHDLRTFLNPKFLKLIERATLWASHSI